MRGAGVSEWAKYHRAHSCGGARLQDFQGAWRVNFGHGTNELLDESDVDTPHCGTGGLLDSTALSVSGQKVSSKQDYNGFGELANLHYSWPGSSYLESMTRDGLGRIATMSEAVSGDSARSYFYTYTTAGRLRAVRRLFGVDTLVIGQYGVDPDSLHTLGALVNLLPGKRPGCEMPTAHGQPPPPISPLTPAARAR